MNVSKGDRVRLTSPMLDDPDPIPVGSEGTVNHVGASQIGVAWDSGRWLPLLIGIDKFVVISREVRS